LYDQNLPILFLMMEGAPQRNNWI